MGRADRGDGRMDPAVLLPGNHGGELRLDRDGRDGLPETVQRIPLVPYQRCAGLHHQGSCGWRVDLCQFDLAPLDDPFAEGPLLTRVIESKRRLCRSADPVSWVFRLN